MDEKINEQHAKNDLFSSILRHDYSFTSQISAEYFCSSLIKQLQENLEDRTSSFIQDNSNLIALSAFIELIELFPKKEQPPSAPSYVFCDKKRACESSRLLEVNAQKECLQGSEETVSAWIAETLTILSCGKITNFVIGSLHRNESMFSNYLLRKVVSTGLRSGFFEVEYILHCFAVHLLTPDSIDIAGVELLKDIVSYSLQRDIVTTNNTFSWFEHNDIIHKLSQSLNSNSLRCEFSEIFLLLQKVVKLALACSETSNVHAFLKTVFCKLLFPNTSLVLRVGNKELQNSLCLQFFKIVDNFLVLEWLSPDQEAPHAILHIIRDFNSRALNMLSLMQNYNVFIDYNFMGAVDSKKAITSNKFCTNLMRIIFVVFLKACAILVHNNQANYQELICSLKPFLQSCQMTIEQPTNEGSLKIWLDTYFVDQDDHWISALHSLLILHTHLKKSQLDPQTALGAYTSVIPTVKDFLFIFCPHKIFCHFAEFVDYDYLVLLDFLINPETSFLPYFLYYLHYLIEDWEHFLNCFEKKSYLNKIDTKAKYDNVCEALRHESHNIIKRKDINTDSDDLDANAQSTAFQSTFTKSPATLKTAPYIVPYSDSDTDTSDNSSSPTKKTRLSPHVSFDSNLSYPECSAKNTVVDVAKSTCLINSLQKSTKLGQTIADQNNIDHVMGMLIRLRLHLNRLEEKGLFPYSAKPLVRVMKMCEEKYEAP